MEINKQKFTDEELTIMQDALDAWVDVIYSTDLTSTILRASLSGAPSKKLREEVSNKRQELKDILEVRKRQATLIKAKLINAQISAISGSA